MCVYTFLMLASVYIYIFFLKELASVYETPLAKTNSGPEIRGFILQSHEGYIL